MKRSVVLFYCVAALVLTLFISGCEVSSANTANTPGAQQATAAAVRSSNDDGRGSGAALKDSVSEFLRQNLFYLWRDRESCSAVRINLPETTPPQHVILTSASCLAGNPRTRSRSVVTPRFVLDDLIKTERLRNSDFLKRYLFDRNRDMEVSSLVVEHVAQPQNGSDAPAVLWNKDR